MRKLVITTYVLRLLGALLIVVALFGQSLIVEYFPGMTSIDPFFYSGVAVYLVGAIIHFMVTKKEKADRRQREIEEAKERAFGGRKD